MTLVRSCYWGGGRVAAVVDCSGCRKGRVNWFKGSHIKVFMCGAVEDGTIPRVLARDVPDNDAYLGGSVQGLSNGGSLGRDLQVGHQRAVVEDKKLQVGAFEDLGGQLGRLHVWVVMIFAHEAVEESGAAAQGMMAQMVHKVCHDHPCRQRDQLHVSATLFWWEKKDGRMKKKKYKQASVTHDQ